MTSMTGIRPTMPPDFRSCPGRRKPRGTGTAERVDSARNPPVDRDVQPVPRGAAGYTCPTCPGRDGPPAHRPRSRLCQGLDRSKNSRYRPPVRAIRRFTVRPVLPAALRRPGRPGRQPAVVLAPGDAGRLRGHRPRALGSHRSRPGQDSSAPSAGPDSTSWRPTSASSGASPRRTPTSSEYLTGDRWFQKRKADEDAAGDRVLLPGVRHHRGAAAVLRRPRHPRRRPPQDGQRPRRADHRRRAALPARLLPSRRSPARAGSRRPTRSSTPTACRSRCCARPTAPGADLDLAARRSRPAGPHLGGAGRPGAAAAARLRRRGQPRPLRDVTDRLYGGKSEHRLRQELLLGVGGVRGAARLLPDHRRPGPRGLPHQRGPRRLPRPRAHPRAHRGGGWPEPRLRHRARGHPRRHRLHHAHAGARRHRPVPAGRSSSSTSASQRHPGVPIDRILGLGTEDYDGGDAACSTWR